MAFESNLYPQEVINKPLTPYVYFLNLPDEILDKVAVEFNRNLSDFHNNNRLMSNDTNVIEQAFSFLKAVIQSERAKEEAFLQYLKDKTHTTFDLELPAIDSDWKSFVQEIQELVGFSNTGLKDLSNELKRLQGNKAKFDNMLKADPTITKTWGIADTIGKVSDQMKSVLSFFNDKFSPSSNAYKIIETVVMRYKDQLLAFDSDNKLILDEKSLLATIEVLSTEITHLYISNSELFKINGHAIFNADLINQLLDEDERLDANARAMITNMQQLPKLRESVVKSLHLNNNQRNKRIDIKKFTKGEQITDNSKIIMETLYNLLRNFKVPEKAFSIITEKPTWAEIESLVKMVISGAVSAHNTGSSFAKPDNIIGYFAVDPSKMDPKNNKEIKALITKIESFQKKLADVAENVRKDNTTEYYKKQSEVWQQLADETDKILNELHDKYDILASCFVIEDSTKNYVSLYAKKEDGELATGPHGGSLGASLEDQIAKIEALTSAGGITIADKDWLIAAIINSGDNMIAGKLRGTLEDYLAMFAAILLFDGQINIAAEAFKRATGSIQTSVYQLHLFSVNNGYYPLSYVLKLTYDSLAQGLGKIEADARQGVQTNIYGHISEPIFGDTPQDSWNKTADAALKSTKIKMKFLVNLANTITNLLPE